MGKLADYLKHYDNQSTAIGYSAAIFSFIDFIYGKQRKGTRVTPEERIKYEKLIDKYLKEKRKYSDDMAGFVISLQSRPPLSAKQTFTFVKEFFNHYNVELPAKDLKFIRNKLPKGNTRTIEKDMDIETIRTILQHLDVKGKALVLVLASSGMRINEALSVTLDDIDFKTNPTIITIRGENSKTGDNRITFMSSEAAQAVNEWLKVRTEYIRTSATRNNGLVKSGRGNLKTGKDDGRLFPFSDQNASVLWDNALMKANLLSRDKTTNRKQLHYHQLRKFFISQLSLIISKEIGEMLAGHAGYLTDAYRRYTKKQLAEEYLKGQHLVTIQTPKELQEIESEFKAKIQTHEGILTNIIKENIELKQQTQELKKYNEEIEKRLGHTEGLFEFIVKNLPELKEYISEHFKDYEDEDGDFHTQLLIDSIPKI
ncbi:MAG: site-specific integrase [Methanoregula sp.]|jgi:integrase|uniref:site-specific integrase n=1 Tax=Methanoregula sp. TaxID=2052170 RepID=UPI003C1AAE86